jgi:hypothetical protein
MKTIKLNVPVKYLPKKLSKKDFLMQKKQLLKSKKLYKNRKYHTRKQVSSYKSKRSKHYITLKKLYNVDKITLSELSKKTKCSKHALNKIIKKGQGAYYSSGSRPNQTAHSWGLARLASAVTGGKASVIDYKILEEGCEPKSRAISLAKKAIKKYGKTTRRVPKH